MDLKRSNQIEFFVNKDHLNIACANLNQSKSQNKSAPTSISIYEFTSNLGFAKIRFGGIFNGFLSKVLHGTERMNLFIIIISRLNDYAFAFTCEVESLIPEIKSEFYIFNLSIYYTNVL